MPRKEEYKSVRAKPLDVKNIWEQFSSIPSTFAVGTAQHETNFAINELDTEENGFQTWGIYQISKEEAKEVGMPDADLLNLVSASQVFAKLMEKRLIEIVKACKLQGTPYVEFPKDIWAYLAIAHNQGLAASLKTIKSYGLDWEGYKKRNPTIRIVSSGYGDDVITGGPDYPK